MELGISGKTALVWGGSRGLGKAAALQLTREGVQVYLLGRTEESLASAARDIGREAGVEPAFIVADMTREADRASVVASVAAPDILINNADGPVPGDFRSWRREDWLDALDAMMLGPIDMIRRVVDGMAEREFGRIINITSRSVKTPQLELGLSNGARSGLTGFVAGLARTVSHRNVTINNILPGVFDTDGQRRHVAEMARQSGRPFEEVWQARVANSTARRFGRAEEFGALAAFLCSQHAGYMTGQNLLIDGGSYPGTF
jgi:3-oxoacyl-[acyl-carrier protein] reductase